MDEGGRRDDATVAAVRALRETARHGVSRAEPERWADVWERCLRWLAFSDFEAYLEYVELDRDPEARFWLPRRKCLARVARALQDVEDGKLDELMVSLPPRVGKSTMVSFFLTWHAGRDPEASNLYTSYSDTVTNAFYRGFLEIVQDPYTYRWADVFPMARVVATDAKKSTVNLQRRKRYASLTCRSIDGTLNGACDASGVMVGDDLCSGIEEASSPGRMDTLASKVNNDWLSRRKQGCPVVWVGTRGR